MEQTVLLSINITCIYKKSSWNGQNFTVKLNWPSPVLITYEKRLWLQVQIFDSRAEEKWGGWSELDMISKNPSSKMANKIMAIKNDVTGSLKNDIQYVAELIAGYPLNF